MAQHAKLSPSSSSRWLTCTASVNACLKYENTTNDAADWGTTVHEIGELLLKNLPIPANVNGMKVDTEMLRCAEDYVDYCRTLIDKNSVQLIEEKFNLSFIAPETFGTCDFCILNGTHLDIVDLKTGHGIVSAEKNPQLMLYALGAIHDLEDLYEIKTVTLHIMQSRAGHISSWDVSVEDLFAFEEFAVKQATRILENDVSFNPENKACQWCAHKANCTALQGHIEEVIKGKFDNIEDIDGKADTINMAHIKRVLDNAELIISFIKAVQDIALEKLQAGVEIEGYKIVAGKSSRKWRDEEEVAEYLKRKISAKDLWVKNMIPMTQILKMLPKDKGLLELLVKPDGKPQIAPLSDKRPALTNVCGQFDDEDL